MKPLKKALSLAVFVTMAVFCVSEERLKVYTVVSGDTLNGIAKSFYADSSEWKKIYAYNDFIKDPHWIFPGDELVIPVYMPEEKQAAKPQPEAPAVSKAAAATESVKLSSLPAEVPVPEKYVESDNFVANYKWKEDGHIVTDKEQRMIIAQGAIVFIELKDGVKTKPGVRMTIYRKGREISDPYTGDELGYIVKKVGVLEIKNNLPGKPITGEIIMSSESVSAGDMLKIVK